MQCWPWLAKKALVGVEHVIQPVNFSICVTHLFRLRLQHSVHLDWRASKYIYDLI